MVDLEKVAHLQIPLEHNIIALSSCFLLSQARLMQVKHQLTTLKKVRSQFADCFQKAQGSHVGTIGHPLEDSDIVSYSNVVL